jgi:hypothetical protein
MRECDEDCGQLCRDIERSRSSFTNKYLAVLRIDLLRQSFCLAIIWEPSLFRITVLSVA